MKSKRRAGNLSDRTLRRYYSSRSSLASGRKLEGVEMRFPKPRRLVALRLEEDTVSALRRLAARRGLNFSTLMRMWITERLSQERAE